MDALERPAGVEVDDGEHGHLGVRRAPHVDEREREATLREQSLPLIGFPVVVFPLLFCPYNSRSRSAETLASCA